MNKAQEDQTYWVGIDWGAKKHAVAVCDDRRHIVLSFEIETTLEGLNTLVTHLREFQRVVGVAIETPRDPVVVRLLKEGYAVYPVNPKLSHNWRKCTSVAEVKSDEYDAGMLALELSRRHESLTAIRPKEASAQEFLGLCDTVRFLIDQRTSHLQRLHAVLRRYYPAALDFWEDITAPSAWAFIKQFSTPTILAKTRKDTLIKFLRAHRIGLRPCWLERIDKSRQAAAWPASPTVTSDELMALACVAQLQALEPRIKMLEKKIAQEGKGFEALNLIESLPGAGKSLAPAITAIIVNLEEDGDAGEQLRRMAGVAPVQDESGKRVKTVIRRRCNKRWRNVFHLFAWCSIRRSTWANAFYRLCRERGDSFATALRKLADKWIRIIICMIREKRPYDEKEYINSLRKGGSPIYERLCG